MRERERARAQRGQLRSSKRKKEREPFFSLAPAGKESSKFGNHRRRKQKNSRISKFPKEITEKTREIDEKTREIDALKRDKLQKEFLILNLKTDINKNKKLQTEKNSLVYQNTCCFSK